MIRSIGGQPGNKNAEKRTGQNDHFVSECGAKTRATIAEEHGLSNTAVRRAVEFGRGLDAAEKASPGIKDAVLSGEVKAPRSVIAEIRNLPEEKQKETAEAAGEAAPVVELDRTMKKAPDKKSEA